MTQVTWLELGLFGALGLLATGLMLLSRWSRMPDRVRPYAAATFAVATLMIAAEMSGYLPPGM